MLGVCEENEEETKKNMTTSYNILQLKYRLWKPVEKQ